jgi:hypothetical protein
LVPVCPEKGENPRFLLCPLSYPPSEGWVVAGDPPEIKLDVGVSWGDSEPLLMSEPFVRAGRYTCHIVSRVLSFYNMLLEYSKRVCSASSCTYILAIPIPGDMKSPAGRNELN